MSGAWAVGEGRSPVIKLVALLVILIAALGWTVTTKGNQMAATGLIRFHVIANSDDPQDQFLKREVRDRLLAVMAPKLGEAISGDEAREIVKNNLSLIEAEAGKVLAAKGHPAPVKAMIGNYPFPTKAYGSLVLPAGSYVALRVIIGQGQGANWWCVLFPPLCFVDISKGSVTSGKTVIEPGTAGAPQRLRVRFKTGEIFEQLRLAVMPEPPGQRNGASVGRR